MKGKEQYDVIIVGGSYSGLAAGLALGRSLRNVLIIDSGLPCNRQTPHSHNFITHDGKVPAEIAAAARRDLEKYETVEFLDELAVNATRTNEGFTIRVSSGEKYEARKLVFATGIKDIMPDIEGHAECWGISVIHCPYCHGYEVRNVKTGILANGDSGFEFCQLISNWTRDLTLFTNGISTLTAEQNLKLKEHRINVVENAIRKIDHENGSIRKLLFEDGTEFPVTALYSRTSFQQHCDLPASLGCEMSEEGYIKVDGFLRTSIPGVFACGDNVARMRSVANAVAMGTFAGAALNKEIISEEF